MTIQQESNWEIEFQGLLMQISEVQKSIIDILLYIDKENAKLDTADFKKNLEKRLQDTQKLLRISDTTHREEIEIRKNLERKLKNVNMKLIYMQSVRGDMPAEKRKIKQNISDNKDLMKMSHDFNILQKEIKERDESIDDLTDKIKKELNSLEEKAKRADALEEENKQLKKSLGIDNYRQFIDEISLDLPDEHEEQESSVQKVKRSYHTKRLSMDTKNVRNMVAHVSNQLKTIDPMHPKINFIIQEYGSVENFMKDLKNEEENEAVARCLKLISCLLNNEINLKTPRKLYQGFLLGERKNLDKTSSRKYSPKKIRAGSVPQTIERGISLMPESAIKGITNNTASFPENWNEFLSKKSLIRTLRGNQVPSLKQVFNRFTTKRSEYFDPCIQYGGESVLSINPRKDRGRYRIESEEINAPHNRIQNPGTEATGEAFPERIGWQNLKDFFDNSGSNSPHFRKRSPDKITTPWIHNQYL